MSYHGQLLPQNADDQFGPIIACAHTFDFTLVFEQSILSIGPSAIFISLSLLRFSQLRKTNVKITRGILGYAKVVGTPP
jgi:hypothetical protein